MPMSTSATRARKMILRLKRGFTRLLWQWRVEIANQPSISDQICFAFRSLGLVLSATKPSCASGRVSQPGALPFQLTEDAMAFCVHCGTQVAEGVTFCPNCGKAVAQPDAGVAAAAPPPPYTAAAGTPIAENVAGMLAYFTIVPAIIFLLIEPYN